MVSRGIALQLCAPAKFDQEKWTKPFRGTPEMRKARLNAFEQAMHIVQGVDNIYKGFLEYEDAFQWNPSETDFEVRKAHWMAIHEDTIIFEILGNALTQEFPPEDSEFIRRLIRRLTKLTPPLCTVVMTVHYYNVFMIAFSCFSSLIQWAPSESGELEWYRKLALGVFAKALQYAKTSLAFKQGGISSFFRFRCQIIFGLGALLNKGLLSPHL